MVELKEVGGEGGDGGGGTGRGEKGFGEGSAGGLILSIHVSRD